MRTAPTSELGRDFWNLDVMTPPGHGPVAEYAAPPRVVLKTVVVDGFVDEPSTRTIVSVPTPDVLLALPQTNSTPSHEDSPSAPFVIEASNGTKEAVPTGIDPKSLELLA
jgi:hypothetical protein